MPTRTAPSRWQARVTVACCSDDDLPDPLDVDDVAPHAGTDLPVDAAGTRRMLRLGSATPSPSPTSRPLPEFSLPVHGAPALCFTPLRRDARGVVYEAVFHRCN